MTMDVSDQAPEPDDPPEGYAPLQGVCEAEEHAGPYYIRNDAEGAFVGFRVKRRHLNRGGLCHGGVLATLADMNITPFTREDETGEVNPTISMSVDYLAGARHGQWVAAKSEILRRTRNIIFSQCLITADGVPVVRASVVYKIGEKRPARSGG